MDQIVFKRNYWYSLTNAADVVVVDNEEAIPSFNSALNRGDWSVMSVDLMLDWEVVPQLVFQASADFHSSG